MKKFISDIPSRRFALPVFLLILLQSCQESWQERMRRETEIMSTRQCPHYITLGLIADSIAYYPEANARYDYFTLVDSLIDTTALTPENLEMAHKALLVQIVQNIELRTLKSHEASFHFVYRLQSTGEVIVKDSVTVDEYLN